MKKRKSHVKLTRRMSSSTKKKEGPVGHARMWIKKRTMERN